MKEGKIIQFPRRRMESGEAEEIPLDEIFVLDGEITLKKVADMEACFEEMASEGQKTLTVEIMSRGGDVDAVRLALSTFDRLKAQHGVTIRTLAKNHVYSAGFDIAVLGDERLAYPDTVYYFHDTQLETKGNLAEVREDVKDAVLSQRAIEKRIARRSGLPLWELRACKNKYLTEHQAMERNFNDGVMIFERQYGGR